jgi:hypothetical protein
MLMGAGRSIAVQNFNEQAAILALGVGYSTATGAGLSSFAAITGFGALVALVMWGIQRWHHHNQEHHGEELSKLLKLTRDDHHTGHRPPGQ